MITVEDGRTLTMEIVALLEGMSPEQKLRIKDMVAVASIMNKKHEPEPEQKTA